MTLDTSELCTVRTAAKRLNVTTASVYLWIKAHRIPSLKIDGVAFVYRDSLASVHPGKWPQKEESHV